jgi:oligoendopeptidase F
MTKPRVSTVLPDEDDDASIIDDMFAKLDLCTTSAVEASKITDAKEASLRTSSGLDDYMSAAEARDTANVAEAREAKQGLFSQFRSHMSNLKSPFNQKDTSAPVEVSLD